MPIDCRKELYAELPVETKGTKRSYEDVDAKTLPPWLTPAARLFRAGQRSAMDDANSLSELWDWLKSRDPKSNVDRCELASADAILRGVAISRFAGAWEAAIEDLLDPARGWGDVLKPAVYEAIKKEADVLLPHFRNLNGRGLRARAADPMTTNMRLGQDKNRPMWKDQTVVEESARYLLEWIGRSGKCKVRYFFAIAAQSGLSYSAWVDHQVVSAYVNEGGGKDSFVDDAVARLCQGSVTPKKPRSIAESDNPFKDLS